MSTTANPLAPVAAALEQLQLHPADHVSLLYVLEQARRPCPVDGCDGWAQLRNPICGACFDLVAENLQLGVLEALRAGVRSVAYADAVTAVIAAAAAARRPPELTYIVAAGYEQAELQAERLGLNYHDRTRVRVINTAHRGAWAGMRSARFLEHQVVYAEGASMGRFWHEADAWVQATIAKTHALAQLAAEASG
jgi:hypothetical protein